MKIDKNNWWIREKYLTNDQCRDVAKYLVKNYKEGANSIKVVDRAVGGPCYFKWFCIGVFSGYYSIYDTGYIQEEITYQDFLTHIKGEQMQTEKTSLVDQLKLAADTVKRLKAITGSDVEIDSNGIIRIEAFNNIYSIDIDKRSEAEINSLIDSIIVLNEWD